MAEKDAYLTAGREERKKRQRQRERGGGIREKQDTFFKGIAPVNPTAW